MIAYIAIAAVVLTPFVGLVVRLHRYIDGTPREWIEAALGMFVLGLLFVAIEVWVTVVGVLLVTPS